MPRAASRFLAGLGLAARAGQLRVGFDAVSRSLGRGEVAAVILAHDAPHSARKRLARLLQTDAPPHAMVLDGERLGRAIGRERVVVLAITDGSLGARVLELAQAVEG